ncbi:Tubulin--tyrosine ligase-like protein 9 [Aphelenchoides besseyi]|nr:Tubulin--tyrosine ligase-like protein 9 [Aphelenchoides besseyi]KAI6199880.1 Tubulin--tyrosine ligase-like protein 9 [Aphelenchoides besseyi]
MTTSIDINRAVGKRRRILWKCSLGNTILEVLNTRSGWSSTTGEDWQFFWVNREWMLQSFDRHKFKEGQLVCHFRNDYELTRKDSIIKNHKKARKLVENQNKMDYLPASYVLPTEYHIFVEEFKKYPSTTIWIMKPVSGAQGRGIFLFKKLKDITEWKKFRPLFAWVHREGFARFSHSRYSLESCEDAYVHLTNVAIAKSAVDYDPERTGNEFTVGGFDLIVKNNEPIYRPNSPANASINASYFNPTLNIRLGFCANKMSSPHFIVIGGTSGSGKSTVACEVAERLGYNYVDGDDYHTESHREKMSQGIGLNDRLPWLKRLSQFGNDRNKSVVLACSALKRSYRQILGSDHRSDEYHIFMLVVENIEVLKERLSSRYGHYAKVSLLNSQLRDLELPNKEAVESNVTIINANRPIAEIVNEIVSLVNSKTK